MSYVSKKKARKRHFWIVFFFKKFAYSAKNLVEIHFLVLWEYSENQIGRTANFLKSPHPHVHPHDQPLLRP